MHKKVIKAPKDDVPSLLDWAEEVGLSIEEFTFQIMSCAASIAVSELDKKEDPYDTNINYSVADSKSQIILTVQRISKINNETSITLH